MSRTMAVIKREFTETVQSKSFLIGTVLGPILMLGFFALQFAIISRGGGGAHEIAIVDATGRGIGAQIETMLESGSAVPGARSDGARATYTVETSVIDAAEWETVREGLRTRVRADELDGYLWLPSDLAENGTARYEGDNATNASVISDLRAGMQRVVQTTRLAQSGIDAEQVGAALRPVRMEAAKLGEDGASGSAEAALVLGIAMTFAIYMAVLLYGASVMNGVLEEKRDKIVELILSSIKAQQLMLGKVIGIGSAGLLQMAVWVTFAVLVITQGEHIAALFGADSETIAQITQSGVLAGVPASTAIIFLLFFAGGFFIYASLYASLGAITTTAQEAQGLVFPIIMPLLIGMLVSLNAVQNPDATMVVVCSLIPLTSPLVMPVRVAMGGVPILQLILSVALLFATALAVIWVGAKIYRIGILATGTRPKWSEIWRWIRTA